MHVRAFVTSVTRSRVALTAVGLGVAGAAAFAVAAVPGKAAGPPGASQLLRTALANAEAYGSAHQTLSESFAGKVGKFTDDVATQSGRQVVVFSDGARAKILVADRVAYISGNQKALVNYFGFPPSVAPQVGGSWVSVPSANSAYATVASAATLPSALADITPAGHLSETAPATVDGKAVIGIRGAAPAALKRAGSATLYLSRTTHPLPVSATIDLGGNPRREFTTTLTDWGERVSIAAPTNALPLTFVESLPMPKPGTASAPPPPTSGFTTPSPGVWGFALTVVQSTFADYADDVDASPLSSVTGGATIKRACSSGCYEIVSGFTPNTILHLHASGHSWQGVSSFKVVCDPSIRKPPSTVRESWTMQFTNGGRSMWARVKVVDSAGCEPGHGTAIVQGTWNGA